MPHAPKPDFVFRRNGRVYLNRRRVSVQSTTGSRVVRINVSNAGYTMFRGSVKSTGYSLNSPVSPSLPLQCVTVCHHVSFGPYIPGNTASRQMDEHKSRILNANGEMWDHFAAVGITQGKKKTLLGRVASFRIIGVYFSSPGNKSDMLNH